MESSIDINTCESASISNTGLDEKTESTQVQSMDIRTEHTEQEQISVVVDNNTLKNNKTEGEKEKGETSVQVREKDGEMEFKSVEDVEEERKRKYDSEYV